MPCFDVIILSKKLNNCLGGSNLIRVPRQQNNTINYVFKETDLGQLLIYIYILQLIKICEPTH